MTPAELLPKVKANLIITHDADDAIITGFIAVAISYAEQYQHMPDNFYADHNMSPTTEHGVIMLASHFYESRDGGVAGFFNETPGAAEQSIKTINMLLRLGRDWKV